MSNQKDRDKLNQTRVSSNYLDSSYQLSMFVSNSNSNNSQLEITMPLHSHFNPSKSHRKTKHNISQQQSNNSLQSSYFRLLNSGASHDQKKNQNEIKLNTQKNTIAFGSTQKRRIPIFQGANHKHIQRSEIGYADFSKTFVKNNKITYQNRQQIHAPMLSQQKSNEKSTLKTKQKLNNNPNLGFGVSTNLQRTNAVIYKNGSPGPGYYQLSGIFSEQKSKNIKKAIVSSNRTNNSKLPLTSECNKQIGPGSYNIDDLKSKSQEHVLRDRIRQVILHKKIKNKNLFEKLNEIKNEKKRKLDQQRLQKYPKTINRYSEGFTQSQTCKNSQINIDRLKNRRNIPLRVQLRDKTSKFLQNTKQNTYQQHIPREPAYKYMFSNSFVPKNDHAFQAHYYKPSQIQSQYIFLKATTNPNKNQMLNSCFKSSTIRSVFG